MVTLGLFALTSAVPTTVRGASGDLLWAKRYDGPAGLSDVGRAVASDAQGNAYVAGSVGKSATDGDLLLLKYSSHGRLLWRKSILGTAHGQDTAKDVTVRYLAVGGVLRGYVFVSGNLVNSATGSDIFTAKYDFDGRQLWSRKYSSGTDDESVEEIGVDAAGNVFVAGWTIQAAGRSTLLLKYGPTGVLLWKQQWAPAGGEAWTRALALGYQGEAFLLGMTSIDYSSTIVKYNAAGVLQWAQPSPWGDEEYHSGILDIAADSTGRVHAAGWQSDYGVVCGDYEMTWTFSPGGSLETFSPRAGLGTVRTELCSEVDSRYLAIAVDGDSNVYYTGYVDNKMRTGSSGKQGQRRWTTALPGSGTGQAVVVSGTAVYALGKVGTKVTLARYAAATGKLVWVRTLSGFAGAYEITARSTGVWATGQGRGDAFTARYAR